MAGRSLGTSTTTSTIRATRSTSTTQHHQEQLSANMAADRAARVRAESCSCGDIKNDNSPMLVGIKRKNVSWWHQALNRVRAAWDELAPSEYLTLYSCAQKHSVITFGREKSRDDLSLIPGDTPTWINSQKETVIP